MAQKGCNVIRLAMYTAEYNGYCTSDNSQKQKLKDIIDTGVQAATENAMYVIIDWHILSDGNPNTYKEEAKRFFAEMAERYADNPNVLYEICNEPNGGTSWAEIRRYALEVIPVIREFAPEAIIIVGTPTWSQDVDVAAQEPITGYGNIMYALHFYADTHRDSLRNKCKQAVAAGLPVFVTEYGICDASGSGAINEAEAEKWISLLDGYGISHIIWNLSNKAETSSLLQSSCFKTSGFTMSDVSAGGKWFLNMMEEAGSSSGMIEGEGQDTSEEAPDSGSVLIFISTEVSVSISQIWNAQAKTEGNKIILTPMDYNKVISAGGNVNGIGILLEVTDNKTES
ncbi:MAG: cellulase family glycosylhydrolase [Lachnospiraceae bacterium]